MQIRRPDRFGKRFPEPVEKIEDERFLDLNFFLRAFELANANALPPPGEGPGRERRDEQAEENDWPHAPRRKSVRRRLVVEVLFQIIEDVFETREVLRCGFTERFVRMEHVGVDLLLFFGRRSAGLVALKQLALRSSGAVAVTVENLI